MQNTNIEYRSIIMRCDTINHDAYRNLPDHVLIEYYKEGMETVWKDIQKAAGEFAIKSDAEVIEYFTGRFGQEKELLKKHCLFLKDSLTNQYIGTCMAWHAKQGTKSIPILHWLAVSGDYARQGFARKLITLVLKIFEKEHPYEKIYLHTQPSSYPAIKLYHDFGFHICRCDTYGTAVNEYEKAVSVLKSVMTNDSFESLIHDTVD